MVSLGKLYKDFLQYEENGLEIQLEKKLVPIM